MQTYDLNVKGENGKTEVLHVIDILSETPFNKEYILFKRDNDDNLYASELVLNKDMYNIQTITNAEELSYINETLQEMQNEEN